MKDVLLLIVGAVVGGVVSLWMSVYYQDRWKSWTDRRRRLRQSRAVGRARITDGGPVAIAGRQTKVHLVEGDGEMVFEPSEITIRYRSSSVEPPAIVAAARDRVAAELDDSRQGSATVSSWNSPALVALNSYHCSRSSYKEDASLRLETTATDYATFTATVTNLDSEITKDDPGRGTVTTTLRREFFATRDQIDGAVRHPVPFLANGIGVALLAFTDDNKVILSRRHHNSRARPGERDVSVVEGLHASHDSRGAGQLDIFSAAVRGCQEELGISISADDVQLLGFAVDLTYYQWNFLGLVEARCSADQVMQLHSLHAKDRWEGKIEALDADPALIFDQFRQDGIWDTGLVTTYLAFCHKLGFRRTNQAAEQVFDGRRDAPARRDVSNIGRTR